ncbi:hypothetical protein JF781_02315 [Mycobacterium sp. WUMAC-067]|uniref:hypothetical protein n=1 Tax=unclassified Mycobacterium TaxID=2642494 RepID=UPI001CD9E4F9|nr:MULTISPECIES: hypothetical protein [unclassified Mycobacterium]MCA2241197.1 hypothetical protein [Mycobacterium sp. WUMAC-067]MCA2313336.1 hypothetical protein [Mycobacterium sp. WUMAC-025]
MPDRIDFEVQVATPSLDHYRREWVPGPDVGLAGMWIGAVVSDASGQDYWGLRGADDFLVGMTHVVSPITGFKALQKTFDADPPHLFAEYSSIDWFEPLEYVDSGAAVQLNYYSGRMERDADGFHWYDASERWEIHGRDATDIFTVHVPAQGGIDDEVYYRHQLLWATGQVNGTKVSGYLHQDYAYGPPGMVYPELPIARQLQGMWVSWLHQYDDGELGGGCFWQGRDGVAFGPGYQLKGGITSAHDDVVAKPTFDEDNKLVALDVSIGSDAYSFAFDTSGSPIHFFGRLTSSSTGKTPARSWCWVEYAGGMLTPELLDYMMQRFRLARGR